jgi:hypothetical protein
VLRPRCSTGGARRCRLTILCPVYRGQAETVMVTTRAADSWIVKRHRAFRPIAVNLANGVCWLGRLLVRVQSGEQTRRSSLKERGRVKALVTSDLGCLGSQRTRRSRRRGQGSGGARPRSGRRALRLAPGSTNNVGGGDRVRYAVPQKSEWVGGALVKAGDPGWWAGPGGLPVIPSPRQGAA